MCGCCCRGSKKDPSRHVSENRGCTDIIFLLLYIAFWAGMMYIAVYSIMRGDIFRLLFGYDSYGNTCNMPNKNLHKNISNSGIDLTGSSNVFFGDIFNPSEALQLCVKKCPDRDLITKKDVQNFSITYGTKLCAYNVDPKDYLAQNFGIDGPCPRLPVPKSQSLLNRCVPTSDVLRNSTNTIIKYLNADDVFRKVLSDLYTSWREILILCLIALGVSLLMVLLIRFLAAIIVWLVVILAIVGSLALTGFLWWTYYQARTRNDQSETMKIPLLDVDVRNERAFLIMSIIATVLTVILLLVILVMRKRLGLVVALFHEAGKCIANMPLLLIQPLWTFILLMLFFAYWIIVLGYISTAGDPKATPKGRIQFEEHDIVRHMWWYHLIGLIWTSEFILACQQMVVSGAVAVWYFTRDKSEMVCPIGKAVCRLILHHIGSVAFGAFIILLVKLPRMILMYIQTKFQGSEGACARCCLKCCMCCLWCLEKFLKFLNQNAYTVIAIEGSNFCSSAQRAFGIIANNVLRVAAINSVGDFILFLGKIGIMAITAAISVVWLKNKPGLHYFAVPVILVCIFAYLIANCFLSIYEMVIDTLLLCFCEDCQMNDGTEGKEYFMSKSLMEFMDNTKAAEKGLERLKTKEKEEKA